MCTRRCLSNIAQAPTMCMMCIAMSAPSRTLSYHAQACANTFSNMTKERRQLQLMNRVRLVCQVSIKDSLQAKIKWRIIRACFEWWANLEHLTPAEQMDRHMHGEVKAVAFKPCVQPNGVKVMYPICALPPDGRTQGSYREVIEAHKQVKDLLYKEPIHTSIFDKHIEALQMCQDAIRQLKQPRKK